MKKLRILFFVTIVIFLLSGMMLIVSAEEVVARGTCGDNLTWELDDEGALRISGTGKMKFYNVMPWSEHQEKIKTLVVQPGVTSIARSAFSDCLNLESVILPKGLSRIETNAFCFCFNLEEINISEGLTYIGSYAFCSCTNLEEINIPEGIEGIKEHTFANCSGLINIEIPDSVTTISDYAFSGCSSLESIVLPKGLTNIGQYTFDSCSGLTNIEIPDSVTTIGYFAFGACSGLTNIEIPDSVTDIGESAFSGCNSLESIVLPNSLTYINRGVFKGCERVEKVVLPKRLTWIDNSAFWGCSGLTNIEIPDSVTTISDYAFQDCSSLESIVLPNSLTYIGREAFAYCSSLSEIVFLGNAPDIQNPVFEEVNAIAYYPYNNTTWTSKVQKAFGGELSWQAKLFAPSVTSKNVLSTGKIKLSWAKVDGAAKYEVYRSKDNKTWSRMEVTTGTSYTNTSAEAGIKYYYKVRAVAEDGSVSEYSNVVNRTCDLARPTIKTSNVASSGKIKLTWEKVDGAKSYKVYRSTDNETWSLLKETTGTSLTNTSATAGKKYYYKVMAIHSTSAANSAYSEVKYRVCDLASPVVTLSNVASTGKIKISWNEIKGAVKYEVYRSTDNKNWSLLSTTTKTSVTNTSAVAGKRYYYKVMAVTNVEGANSAYSEVKYRVCDLASPEVTLSNVASTGKIKISWNEIKGAVKYEVYRSTDNKNWSLLSTTTKTSVTNTSAVAGKRYYYKVKAITNVSGANSAYSEVKYRVCDLARPEFKLVRNSAGKPKLTWEAVKGAAKYSVYYSTDNKTWTKLITTTGTVATHSKAKAGTTYYYKVMAVTNVSGANSAYSPVKYIKAK